MVNTQPTVAVTQEPRPRDYLILTIITIILCAFFGLLVGMLFPLPALAFSLKVVIHFATLTEGGRGHTVCNSICRMHATLSS